jgi:hypothetical protein
MEYTLLQGGVVAWRQAGLDQLGNSRQGNDL